MSSSDFKEKKSSSFQKPRPQYDSSDPQKSDQTKQPQSNHENTFSSAQKISLPSGGGAIRGIGEKFTPNPFTGTFSISVPVFTTPSRSDFYPKLSLSYDSAGKGNGPFGLGWNISVPSISRKTEIEGLPRYNDAMESDIFILSGSEDLVPFLEKSQGSDVWAKKTRASGKFEIQQYRPRVEGLFAKIERWTDTTTGDIHWRTISKDNITTLYGQTPASRVADPNDSTHIFEWMIDESYDDKGNAIQYVYKQENDDNLNPTLSYERNRIGKPYSKCYIKRIKYGNATPNKTDFLFEAVFDYGEHDLNNQPYNETDKWDLREDAFSNYRSGFEIRTQRICKKILMFHLFSELGKDPCLVFSTDLVYGESPIAYLLASITQTGYIAAGKTNPASQKSMPSLVFTYANATLHTDVHSLDHESVMNLPIGLDSRQYKWMDLDGDGIPGILSQQASSWFFKRNLGAGKFAQDELVGVKPSIANLDSAQQEITDLAGDGENYLVQFSNTMGGFHELYGKGVWGPFRPFASLPKLDWQDKNHRFVDLSGYGRADILVSEDQAFQWYHSLGKLGFSREETVAKASDEEKGPVMLFSDPTQTIYVANMTGDGLGDIVRIRNGEICYWPNLGYGRFGQKITMANSPLLDYQDEFNENRIRLADIDGSGTTDLVYLGSNGISIWFNQAGNSWSEEHCISNFPPLNDLSSVAIVDLLAKGTQCIVWSSPLPTDSQLPMRYIDLMGGIKPYLLCSMENNMGSLTNIQYAPSTEFYLEDQASGNPWITKLPFPVYLVKQVETIDQLSSSKLVSRYKYHHGYFDHVECEFRGFGLVEHWDTETFDQFSKPQVTPPNYDLIEKELYVPPVHTKTWYHTGTYYNWKSISKHFAKEYYAGDSQAPVLPDSSMTDGMTVPNKREAYRSLKSKVLREEVHADDDTSQSQDPYTVSEHRYNVDLLQPILDDARHAVFYPFEEEIISCHYERNPADPRIEHTLVFQVDEYGNVQSKATVYYPRREQQSAGATEPSWSSEAFQNQFTDVKATLTLIDYAMIVDQDDIWITGVPCQTRSYELAGINVKNGSILMFSDICNQIFGMASIPPSTTTQLPQNPIDFGVDFTGGFQARLYTWKRNLFLDSQDRKTVLPLGKITIPLLSHYSEEAIAPIQYVTDELGSVTDQIMTDEGGYVKDSGYWWNQGMRKYYLPASSFFLQYVTVDPFGKFDPGANGGKNYYIVSYDKYNLVPVTSIDPLDNIVSATIDYRIVKPWQVVDINNNTSQVVYDELGMVTAFTIFGNVNGISSGDAHLTNYNLPTNISVNDIVKYPEKYLQGATAYFYYDYNAWLNEGDPPYALTLHREVHQNPLTDKSPKYQISLLYSDGLGRQLQKKIMSDPGMAFVQQADGAYKEQQSEERWLTSGKTVFNNKGKPVKQYEPFYSAVFAYEFEDDLVEFGVTPVIHYDPLERVIRTDTPKGFFTKTVFYPWKEEYWDENDTVQDSNFYNDIKNTIAGNIPTDWTHSDWGQERLNAEWQAVQAALFHYGTPTIKHLNCMGQEFMQVDLLAGGQISGGGTASTSPLELYTQYELDINGNKLSITDPRQYEKNLNRAANQIVKNFQFLYDMLNRKLVSIGTDNGTELTLQNFSNKAIYVWNANGYTINTKYDGLQRPAFVYVSGNGLNNMVEQIVYGESPPPTFQNPLQCNLRGQPVQHYDQAGLKEFLCYDIEQHGIQMRTTLRRNYKDEVDWSSSNPTSALDTEQFVSLLTYDALNRIITKNQSDGSIHQYSYDQTGNLFSISVQMDSNSSSAFYVNSILYNAKGQRTEIDYDNNTSTTYVYEKETFRLQSLTTTRSKDGKILQNLFYVYDPVGNITWLKDNSQNVIFYNQSVIQPLSTYAYDSLYRLTQANGRQNFGVKHDDYMNGDGTFKQSRYVAIDDSKALANYTETYQYDDAGNLKQLTHKVDNSTSEGWTRKNTCYDNSNRLQSSQVGSAGPVNTYQYDNAGNMTTLENLQNPINWNYRNNISSVILIPRKEDNSDAEYYVYGSDGMRVRKVLERNLTISGTSFLQTEEKIYLDGYEIKRIKKTNLPQGNAAPTPLLQRFSIHVMDDKTRVALVHKWTLDANASETKERLVAGAHPVIKYHYQLNNHLGSSILELDETGALISYEEYFPYGGTSLIAGNSIKDVSIKDYRYTGKECDEHTGLYYFGARYYVSWLSRWINCDPSGISDGLNLFSYVSNNPIRFTDSSGREKEDKWTSDLIAGAIKKAGGHRVDPRRPEWASGQKSTLDAVTSSPEFLKSNKASQIIAESGMKFDYEILKIIKTLALAPEAAAEEILESSASKVIINTLKEVGKEVLKTAGKEIASKLGKELFTPDNLKSTTNFIKAVEQAFKGLKGSNIKEAFKKGLIEGIKTIASKLTGDAIKLLNIDDEGKKLLQVIADKGVGIVLEKMEPEGEKKEKTKPKTREKKEDVKPKMDNIENPSGGSITVILR